MKSMIHKKYHNEDIITSRIFGPMSYLDDQLIGKKLLQILNNSHDVEIQVNKRFTVDFLFWPNIASKGSVRPDLHISIKDDLNNIIYILIEIKWGSEQTKYENDVPQLVQQWRCSADEKKNNIFHWYLVLDKESAENEVEQLFADYRYYDKKWEKRLKIFNWQEIINYFNDFNYKTVSKGYKQWIDDVLEYYFQLKTRFPPFRGFSYLNDYKDAVDIHSKSVFWNPFFLFVDNNQKVIDASNLVFFEIDN